MQWRDIKPGAVVYHRIYTHWGKGVVEQVVGSNSFERLFERGRLRAVVRFAVLGGTVRLGNVSLRKTPNRKRIREMVELYKKRGVEAVDGGDRLILPEKTWQP